MRMSTVDTSGRCRVAGLAALLATLVAAAAGAQLAPPPEPAGNPLTTSKVNLGKVLFWDEQLSSTRTVSCGTCHIPAAGGDDPRSLESPLAIHPGADGVFGNADDVFGSPGVPANDAGGLYLWNTHFGLTEQATGRRTTSAINAGYSPTLFWDGRAGDQFVDPVTSEVVLESGAALESQAVGPPVSDVEMAHVGRMWTEVLARIGESQPLALAASAPAALLDWLGERTYADLFAEAFGDGEITAGRVAMAIASYERTQFTDRTPFDEFLAGGNALTARERQGHGVFIAARCGECHLGAILTDHDFHYVGVRPPAEDLGRFEVTGLTEDRGRMRTPSLRNLELRAPYMHNGRFETLEEVVGFYNRGGDFNAPNKDPRIRRLFLSPAERNALVAFLGRPLTDRRLVREVAPFDRPRLYTESGWVPVVEGAGLPGSGDLVPRVVALEPPLVGNPSFTVGIFDALGGATALLVIDDADPGLETPAAGDFAFESVVLGGAGAGQGFGSVSLQIPDDPSLAGSEWFGRWYVEDTGGGFDAAVTPLFRFRVFEALPQTVLFIDGFESGDVAAWSSASP